MDYQRIGYPFSAIVGQEKMKLGLLLVAVNHRLGGILLRGEKGTAKSTAVRALAALLPEIEVVVDCPFSCSPAARTGYCPECQRKLVSGEKLKTFTRRVKICELPVSATEDRVVGSLDFEYAIKYGKPRFEPGLLARANRGIIYVDEVNLLDDHIVDVLLDAAASGINVVEREGISYVHPADFLLVGSMNPEEGDLRPQLLDRFGLCAPVEGCSDLRERVEIAVRREAFDADPSGFLQKWRPEEERLREKISEARRRLPSVIIPEELLIVAARLCLSANVAGHRADLILAAAARAHAALNGRTEVTEEDLHAVADLVLFHRAREASRHEEQPEPPEKPAEPEEPKEPPEEEAGEEQPEENFENSAEQAEKGSSPPCGEKTREENRQEDSERGNDDLPPSLAAPRDVVFAVGSPFNVRRIVFRRDRQVRKGSGRRSRTRTAQKVGRYVRSILHRQNNDLAFDATLRAAAPHQLRRRRKGVAIAIETADLREKVREKRIGNFLLFVVDASGSMGARQRMVETKGAILSLLLDAYQKRDKIGLVAFRGAGAEVLLPPTNSVELGHKLLAELPTGGKTPLSAGLCKAYEVARTHLYKDPYISPLLILISDGKANVSLGPDRPVAEARRAAEMIRAEGRIKTLVVDVEPPGFLNFGLARELAAALGAEYYKIDDLRADTLVQAVRALEND